MDSAVIHRLLRGEGTHIDPRQVFDGLDWPDAGIRPDGAPYSIYELLGHLNFWQSLYVSRLRGGPHDMPESAADGWPHPGAPSSEQDWFRALETFRRGILEAQEIAETLDLDEPLHGWEGHSRFEGLCLLAAHNSHHLGQVIMLRRIIGSWPPPGGGMAW